MVTREQLDQLAATNLSDAIKSLPGVNVNPATSYGRSEKLRGMDSDYTLLPINGRRINSRDALSSSYGNDFDLSSIPMVAVERIEVIRGAISSLYGADAWRIDQRDPARANRQDQGRSGICLSGTDLRSSGSCTMVAAG